MAEFNDAQRTQQSLLAPLEKPALIWLASHMPSRVNSDHLTILGFLAMLAAGLCYALSATNRYFLLAVILFLAINWFGDSLDGTVARFRNRLRPRYGFYVDHVIDAVGTCCLLGGMGLSGYMSLTLALLLIIAYFLLSIEVYLATYTIGVFKLSHGKFSPTELRVVLAAGNLALFFRPVVRLFGHAYQLFDVGAVVAIAGMVVLLIRSVIRNTIMLYRQERLP